MNGIKWWQSRSLLSALVGLACAVYGLYGHEVKPEQQSHIVNVILEITDYATPFLFAAAAWYRAHAKHAIVSDPASPVPAGTLVTNVPVTPELAKVVTPVGELTGATTNPTSLGKK